MDYKTEINNLESINTNRQLEKAKSEERRKQIKEQLEELYNQLSELMIHQEDLDEEIQKLKIEIEEKLNLCKQDLN